MYESFFGLRATPFSLLPDPDFLFLSGRHKPGLNILEYGILNRAVFTVLTGEPGTGKTTLLNKVLEEHQSRFIVGVIGTTHPNDTSLLPWVADAFGLDCAGQDTVGYFRTLTSFLKRTFAEGRQVLLVVDEAQNLNLQTLEDLRLLSNLNDGRQAGLQIVLAGQPSLRAMLTRSDMRQFAQRITVDYALEPLSEGDVQAYIRHRLSVVGGEPDLFTEYACSMAHRLSGGTPRLINQLCELSMAYAFGEGAERITAQIVLQVASDRAVGGILPSVIDPKTVHLDPDRVALELPVTRSDADPARNVPESPLPRSLPEAEPGPNGLQPYRQGLDLKQIGQYHEALKKFEAAGQDPALRFRATAQQGMCLRAIGRLDDAVASFRQALAANGAKTGDLMNVRYALAHTLDSMGQSREAQKQYRVIHDIDPLYRDIADRVAVVDDSFLSRGFLLLPMKWMRSLMGRWS
ncbi:MAG: AAA family ATPase [Nitrospira sp.]|nr:AAA family ATPase [Nitrospira sp.]